MISLKVNKGLFSSSMALVVALGLLTHGTAVNAEENKIEYNEAYDTPSYMIGNWKAPKGLNKREIVLAYMDNNSKKFKIQGDDSKVNFEIIDETADKETGTHHFKLVQKYKGIPIYGSDQTISLSNDDHVISYFGQVVSNLDHKNINVTASISQDEAVKVFKNNLEKVIGKVDQYDGEINAEPYIYENNNAFYSTYLVTASTTNPKVGYWHYFIDATNGNVVDKFNAADEVTAFGEGVFGEKRKLEAQLFGGMFRLLDETRGQNIVTYDATSNVNVDVTSINKMFKDGSAVDAHVNAAKTYDYFKDTFGRDSVDDNGQKLVSAVHVGDNWNNASWNGQQMSYGDGDGIRFHPLAAGLDVGAHEMSHGVVQHTAGLIYRNESGALNESYADIFGAMVDRDDWLIGENIMADGSIALRSMEDPSVIVDERTDSGYSPDHWSERYIGNLDNGGVHINSSINNKAAYLMAEGGEHYGVTVKGVGREATEQIYYRALSLYLTSSSDFSMMRQAAIQAAVDLYGTDSDQVKAVEQAYHAVGVN
nr:M4 family metallopeptidase [Virgibacillus halotolerans]